MSITIQEKHLNRYTSDAASHSKASDVVLFYFFRHALSSKCFGLI